VEHNYIDGADFLEFMRSALRRLTAHVSHVNALNVYPVPDGDTGTNMQMSLAAGVSEMEKQSDIRLDALAQALAQGLLMGGRGNSGVILSQLFRGFTKRLFGESRIDAECFAQALRLGVNSAYAAVAKPVEGTILTVAKEAALAAEQTVRLKGVTLRELIEVVCDEARATLARTQEMLPQLRQAGVVDSGGQGLVYIYEGFLEEITGTALPIPERDSTARSVPAAVDIAHSEFGYCTEYIVKLETVTPNEAALMTQIRDQLTAIGDSMLVVVSNDFVKVHLHTEHPGLALEQALTYGSLLKVKIENMTEQHHTLIQDYNTAKTKWQDEVPLKSYGIVAVGTGGGMAAIFQSCGVCRMVSGGETMNPSTDELTRAVDSVHARHVFLLPNNSNVILAAKQVEQLRSDRVTVIPTRSIPQGLAAAIAFDERSATEVNVARMTEAAGVVTSGALTCAVRDATIDGIDVGCGDYIVLLEGKVIATASELSLAFQRLMSTFSEAGVELVTMFAGRDTSEQVVARLREQSQGYSFTMEWQRGEQPIYDFIISAE